MKRYIKLFEQFTLNESASDDAIRNALSKINSGEAKKPFVCLCDDIKECEERIQVLSGGYFNYIPVSASTFTVDDVTRIQEIAIDSEEIPLVVVSELSGTPLKTMNTLLDVINSLVIESGIGVIICDNEDMIDFYKDNPMIARRVFILNYPY